MICESQCDLSTNTPLCFLFSGAMSRRSTLIDQLLEGQHEYVVFGAALPPRPVILAGSFNPLHGAHLAMADLASNQLGRVVHFELSVSNVDKATLTTAEILCRVEQFPPERHVVVTRAPRFIDKAHVMPNATFVVGYDTLERIVDANRYSDEQERASTLAALAERVAGFLVFGRVSGERFCGVEDIELPDCLAHCCRSVSEQEFRADISSTEIRTSTLRSNRGEQRKQQ